MSIPITLVTGFLGSGKSTLINRVIADNPEKRFGLVVNEFGDVKLESQIIEAERDEVAELSNGCMCCVVRGDLLKTVSGLLQKGPNIGHVVLEASGLSDPVPIANTFLNDNLGGRVRFDSVVCVVDPLNFLSSMKDFSVAEVQLRYSDFILISKADVATPGQVERVRRIILSLQPDARIFEMGPGFSTDLVFDTSNLDHGEIAELEIEAHHHDGDGEEDDDETPGVVLGSDGRKIYHHVHESVETLFYKTRKPMDLERFGALMHRLPKEIVRAKGFLDFSDPKAAGKKFVLQIVAGRPVLEAKPWSAGETRQSAMVFIGRDFDKEKLLTQLAACEVA